MLSSNHRLSRPIVLATVVAAALAGTSCGGDDESSSGDRDAAKLKTQTAERTAPLPESPHPVTTAVQALRRAFLANDIKGICARMTKAAKHEAGSVAHGTPTTCVPDVRKAFKLIDKGGGWRHRGEPRMTGLTLKGDQATAVLALGQRLTHIPFAKKDGMWKLNGFFGGPAKRAKSFGPRTQARPFPAKLVLNGPGTEILDPSGDPCSQLLDKQFPTVEGDCEFKVSSGSVPLTLNILTVFGDFQFEKCRIDYRVFADGSGRTWTDTFNANGDTDGACGDVNACFAKDQYVPWRGRIEADGEEGYYHRMDMCLHTCIGVFAGDFVVRMNPDGDRWRTEPVNGGGSTGFRFMGPLAADGGDVELRTADF